MPPLRAQPDPRPGSRCPAAGGRHFESFPSATASSRSSSPPLPSAPGSSWTRDPLLSLSSSTTNPIPFGNSMHRIHRFLLLWGLIGAMTSGGPAFGQVPSSIPTRPHRSRWACDAIRWSSTAIRWSNACSSTATCRGSIRAGRHEPAGAFPQLRLDRRRGRARPAGRGLRRSHEVAGRSVAAGPGGGDRLRDE
jgi:hypothetical protein